MNVTGTSVSADDRRFLEAVVSGALHPRDFRHRQHLRLAYVCLAAEAYDAALATFRRLLHDFFTTHHINPAKYHETLTRAWLQTMHLHMAGAPAGESFDDFIARHPALLDADLMFAHYTRERLVSPVARERFIAPDLRPLSGAPTHALQTVRIHRR